VSVDWVKDLAERLADEIVHSTEDGFQCDVWIEEKLQEVIEKTIREFAKKRFVRVYQVIGNAEEKKGKD
jgi:hypothetical protein